MVRARRNKGQAAVMVSIICCLIFVVFSFMYLCAFQGDMLQMVQHLKSHGRTSYHVFLFSSLITLLLTGAGILLAKVCCFPSRCKALAWFPAFMILGWLTDWSIDQTHASVQGQCLWSYILFGVVYLVVVFFIHHIDEPKVEKASMQTLLWPNFLILVIGMIFTASVANTNRPLHYQLRLERLAVQERYDDILQEGKTDDEEDTISRSLMCMRMYALSRKGVLGDELFAYPNNLGSDALLPTPKDSLHPSNMPNVLRTYLGGFPIHDMNATDYLQYLAPDTLPTPAVRDYLLCALLLDKNLPAFTDSLISYYGCRDTMQVEEKPSKNNRKAKQREREPVHFTSLPRHYAEALLLYSRVTEKPIAVLDDEHIMQNYLDFTSYREKKDSTERQELCRKFYADTYWYYYFFNKTNVTAQ